MKILHLNPAFFPAFSYGGIVNVSYNLCKALAKRGHDVTVYTSDTFDKCNRQSMRYLEHEGIKIFYFKNISNLLAWHRFLFYPHLITALKKNIKQFDIIHLHGTRNFQNVVAVHYAKKYDIPYVLQAHGSLPYFSQHEGLKKLFDTLFGKSIFCNIGKALALNQTEYEQYVAKGVPKNKIEILPNGISSSEPIDPQQGIFKKKYGINNSERIILYVGRIHRTKGLDNLIRAFTIVNKVEENTLLILLGPDDNYKKELTQLSRELNIQDRVRFVGFVPDEDKFSAYVDSEVFVTPSFSGFPITFLEACACGLPIITTNSGDQLEWIHDNVGLVVDDNVEQISMAIIRIISSQSLRKYFGERGVHIVREQFNWDSIINKLDRMYTEIIDETR